MSNLIKYPRTPHVPWSKGASDDDVILNNISFFKDNKVVVTEKMDGENTTMYRDHYHARSLDSANHPSRNYVKSLWGMIQYDIPDGYRICGENCFAKNSC